MTAASALAVSRALTAVMDQDRGRLLSALIARFRDFQLAEDALQEAATSALIHWGRNGLPHSPQGWLLHVAGTKAIDRLRTAKRDGNRAAKMAVLAPEEASVGDDPAIIPDHRLALIFTCCHPALDQKSRVALTLRTLGGLTTAQIAEAFLDAEPTMGQRLSRAKSKIKAAGIPFKLPDPEDLSHRLNAVLTVVYLIFNAGYTAGPRMGADLTAESLYLARLLTTLCPEQPEVEAALALILLTQARHAARIGPNGATVPLSGQNRSLWDPVLIAEGTSLLDLALSRHAPGPFQIKAAIAALHCAPGKPDWTQIAALYQSLLRWEPTPVIRLNHAVAVAEGQGARAGLTLITALAEDLDGYQPYHAARAEYFSRLGQDAQAHAAYDRAIALAPSTADRAFLTARKAALPAKPAV